MISRYEFALLIEARNVAYKAFSAEEITVSVAVSIGIQNWH